MTVSRGNRRPAPTSVIEPHPTPASHELQRIRDVLATDGFSTESDEYGRRARVAERIEDQINKTRDHVLEIERTSAQAHRDYADEVSYDDHLPGRDCSSERGEHIVGWLIEHGWTPPSGLAFATSSEPPIAQSSASDAAVAVPTCSLCRRERTLQDPNDYNPIQVLTGQPVGWYSGEDGEVCPQCMTETLGRQHV